MRPICLLAFVLLWSAVVAAGGGRAVHAAKPAPAGTLTLAIAVADTDLFIDEWTQTPASHAPVIRIVREVGKEKTVYVAFILSGHMHDRAGLSRVEVDIVVRRPDGKVDHSERSFARLSGRECTRPGFAMADPALTCAFGATDPEGVWRIEATARDLVNGKSATAVYPLTVHR